MQRLKAIEPDQAAVRAKQLLDAVNEKCRDVKFMQLARSELQHMRNRS